MLRFTRFAAILVVSALLAGGCEKKPDEGPAERAGKEVDKAISDTGKAIQDFGKQVEDSTKKQKTP